MTKRLSDIEIPVRFNNYKIFKGDKEFVLKNSFIYFISGPNDTGKTSFKDAFAILQTGKNSIDQPVSRGEDEGFIETKIPGADGKMYLIRHDFTDKTHNKFVAIDEDGKKISNITEFRKIFNYTHFTAEEFFLWTGSADGRKKQREIILNLLSETDKQKYEFLCQDEIVIYDQRTSKGHEKDQLIETCKQAKLTDEQVKELDSIDAYKVQFQDMQKEINNIETNKIHRLNFQERIDDNSVKIHNIKADYATEKTKHSDTMKRVGDDILELERQLKTKIEYRDLESKRFPNWVDGKKAEIKKIETETEEYEVQLVKHPEINPTVMIAEQRVIENKIEKLTLLKVMDESSGDNIKKRDTVIRDYEDFTRNIENIRNSKKDLIATANLGVEGISIEDDYVMIDGFEFKENQISKSKAIMLIARLMCSINTSPIQVIGSANDLDWEVLDKLYKMAEEQGKIMILDQVDRDATDIAIVGYEPKTGIVNTDTGEITHSPEKDPSESDDLTSPL